MGSVPATSLQKSPIQKPTNQARKKPRRSRANLPLRQIQNDEITKSRQFEVVGFFYLVFALAIIAFIVIIVSILSFYLSFLS